MYISLCYVACQVQKSVIREKGRKTLLNLEKDWGKIGQKCLSDASIQNSMEITQLQKQS